MKRVVILLAVFALAVMFFGCNRMQSSLSPNSNIDSSTVTDWIETYDIDTQGYPYYLEDHPKHRKDSTRWYPYGHPLHDAKFMSKDRPVMTFDGDFKTLPKVRYSSKNPAVFQTIPLDNSKPDATTARTNNPSADTDDSTTGKKTTTSPTKKTTTTTTTSGSTEPPADSTSSKKPGSTTADSTYPSSRTSSSPSSSYPTSSSTPYHSSSYPTTSSTPYRSPSSTTSTSSSSSSTPYKSSPSIRRKP